MRRFFALVFGVLIILVFIYPSGEVLAETVAVGNLREHFEGKTIRIVHGSSPGGGYDLIARALALVLPKYLPGKPATIIVEPRPGGGPFRLNSLKALIRAKPDGLTIGYAYSAWIVAEALGEGPAAYNLNQLSALGTPMGGLPDQVYCANRKVAASWNDIEKLGRPITWGGIAPGVTGVLLAVPWLKEIGAPVNVVWGYGGSTETNAAFRRGELELIASCTGNLYRDYPDWANRDNVAAIFWFGESMAGTDKALKKMGLKRPPHIYDIAQKYIKSDWQKDAFEAGMQFGRLSRAFFAPAGMSKDVHAVWLEVFRKTVGDPQFVNALHPTYRDDVAPMYGEEMARILGTIKQLSPRALGLLKILATGR